MVVQNGRGFNEWLRTQLKAKKMSQRQLAQQSGVDHSTISRLIRGDRMPSLGTATKLARGLREIRDDAEAPQYLGTVTGATTNPTARVEYALRADDVLTEPQVRQVMEYYLAVRMRRFGRGYAGMRTEERPMEPRRLLDDRRDGQIMSAVASHSVRRAPVATDPVLVSRPPSPRIAPIRRTSFRRARLRAFCGRRSKSDTERGRSVPPE